MIRRTIRELHEYVDRKAGEIHEIETPMRALDIFNHRQVEIVRHALKHPDGRYTIAGHRKSHTVVFETARTDLLDISKRGVLDNRRRGKQMVFSAPARMNPKRK